MTTLDCSAQEIRHILRIHPDRHSVEDLSFDPPRTGTAEVTDAGYALRFGAGVPGYELVFRINRFTNNGTRILTDWKGQTGVGHGSYDLISCKAYEGKPL